MPCKKKESSRRRLETLAVWDAMQKKNLRGGGGGCNPPRTAEPAGWSLHPPSVEGVFGNHGVYPECLARSTGMNVVGGWVGTLGAQITEKDACFGNDEDDRNHRSKTAVRTKFHGRHGHRKQKKRVVASGRRATCLTKTFKIPKAYVSVKQCSSAVMPREEEETPIVCMRAGGQGGRSGNGARSRGVSPGGPDC